MVKTVRAEGRTYTFPDDATDEEIEDAINEAAPPPMSMGEDVVRSVGQGLQNIPGFLLGLPGDVQQIVRSGADATATAALRAMGKSDEEIAAIRRSVEQQRSYRLVPDAPTSADVTGAVEGVTGFHHDPQTVAGEYARTAAEFAPALLAPGSIATRATRALVPAAASETAGQAARPYGEGAEIAARIAGGLGGGIATELSVAANARRAAARSANPDNAALEAEFGPMTAGERSGNARQRLEEDDFRRGIGSEAAQRTIQAFDDRRVPDIRNNINRIATRGQEPVSEDLSGAGTTVADALRTRVDDMRTRQSDLYRRAFDLAESERVSANEVASELLDRVDAVIAQDFLDAGPARAIVGRLQAEIASGQANYGTVERARQALNRQLSSAMKSQDDAGAYAITRIIDEVDNFVAPRLSPEASRAITEARGFTREMLNQFGRRQRTDLATGHQGRSDPGGGAIERVLNTDLTGEQVVDAILGAGTKPSQATLGAVRRIREINDGLALNRVTPDGRVRAPGRIKLGGQTRGERQLAADSEDARYGVELPNPELQGLREALFHRVLAPLKARNEGGIIPAQTVVTNLRRALDGPGAEITRTLFTEREQAAMRRALGYMERLVPPTGSAFSGTTPAFSRMIQSAFDKLTGMIPGIGPVLREAAENMSSTDAARRAVRPPRSTNAPNYDAEIDQATAVGPLISGGAAVNSAYDDERRP